ncbi:MAG: acyl-CoA thioesterase [Myxococcota bacterium]
MTDAQAPSSTVNPLSDKELTMTLLMTPDKANFSGKVHGGAMLKMLDEVAYTCAARYSGHYAVTLSVDQVLFMRAINVGDLVTFLAMVNYTGRTSMEVGIRVVTEGVTHRTCTHAMTCYFTMIAMDEEGRPTPVPPLEPKTPIEKMRYEAAKWRRELRSEVARRYQEIRAQST